MKGADARNAPFLRRSRRYRGTSLISNSTPLGHVPRRAGPGMQGHLAHTQQPPPRKLSQDYAYDPVVVPGAGGFRVSEAPLYLTR